MIEYTILIFSFIILTLLFFSQKLYRYPSFFFYWGAIIIFLSPATYAFFGGGVYRMYKSGAEIQFYVLGFLSIWLIVVFYIFRNIASLLLEKSRNIAVDSHNLTFSSYWKVFVVISIGYSALYFFAHINHWPIFKMLSGDFLVRPDIDSEGFQFYFFTSVVYQVVLPVIFFQHFEIHRKKRIKNFFFFCLLVLLLIAGGNKGIMLYFFIFCWLFALRNKNIFVVGFMCVLSLVVYALAKGVSIGYDTLADYLLESIFRRIFVTQGISIPNALEMFAQGVNFYPLSSNEVKIAIYDFVYGSGPGSMPIFFTAELYLRFGAAISIMLSLLIVFGLAAFSSIIERHKNLSLYWCGFYAFFVFVMSGVSEANLYRFAFVFFIAAFIIMANKQGWIKRCRMEKS
ncbi:hypothetical protein [Siccibacter colletis]|uniref:hypothetical protein n=1 Tax=Siccibacter colletis TaxID=1505757 RepID=UPI003CEAEDBF